MRIWMVLLLIAALVAGCAGKPAGLPGAGAGPAGSQASAPTAGEAGPSGSGAPTAPGSAANPGPGGSAGPGVTVAFVPLEISSDGLSHTITFGEERFVVSTRQVLVHATVHAKAEEEALAAVRITGAEPLWPPEARLWAQPDLWTVDAFLGEGKAGDTVTAAVTTAPGQPPVQAAMTRKAPPVVTILLQGEDGGWAPLQSGVSLPPGPKRLRIQTTGGLSVDSLNPTFVTSDVGRLSPDRTTRVADNVLEVAFTNPPPLVQVLVGGGYADGLAAPEISGHFYIGEPPELVAVNPATGEASRIGPAPADLNGFPVLRKDGRYLALTTLLPEAAIGQAVWLVDLMKGTLTRTPFQYDDGDRPGFDARGRLIASAGPGRLGVMEPESGSATVIRTAATFWGTVSPDGRSIAGRVGPPPGRSTGAWVGPPRARQLVVRDLLHDTEQVFPWGGYGGLVWLPDGRLLLSTVSSNAEPGDNPPPERRPQLFTVDLANGQRTPYSGLWSVPDTPSFAGSWPPGDRPLVTLPDGRILVYRWANAPNARRGLF